jgi:DNA-binding MarR family transcriptional regulator
VSYEAQGCGLPSSPTVRAATRTSALAVPAQAWLPGARAAKSRPWASSPRRVTRNRHGWLLRGAGSLLTARLNRLLQADCGLSLPEYEVLVQLSEAPRGKLRPFQLGLALDWEQSRLSHMLSRMGRRGFVVRQDCAGDRRGAEVALTAAGRAAIESAAPGHVAAVRRLVFDQMDSEQAVAFGQVFEAILAGLENSGPR